MWRLEGPAVVPQVMHPSAAVHIHQFKNELNSLPPTALGFHTEWRETMTLRKALITAAVLLLSAPVVPALAHDDEDNGYSSHDRYHEQLSDQHDDAHGYQAPRYNDYYPRRQYRFYREY